MQTPMSAGRLLSLLCLGACVTALVGCGDTLSFDPVASAASNTVESESARVDFWAEMTIDGVGGMSFDGKGIFDGRTRSGALNMRFNLPAEARAQLGNVDASMQMIMDGRNGLIVYMRSPLLGAFAGGKWVKLDMQKLAKKQGFDMSTLMNANQADPAESLRMLKASSDARVLGYDRVRGIFTTHYTLKIDLERATEGNDQLRKMVENVKELTGEDTFPAEAWIDDQGRVRRFKIDMSFNTPQAGAFRMTMTEELYAFGVKFRVRPPAASQVIDASAALNLGG
jgi:hypothetical protein